MSSISTSQITLDNLIETYLDTRHKLGDDKFAELEIKFGTRQINKITKNKFDNVVQYLLANNFNLVDNGKYYLSIKTDDVRVEIHNLINIQDYCKTNVLPSEYPHSGYNFNEKNIYRINDTMPARVNFDTFNFRVTYSVEKNLSAESDSVKDILKNWHSINKFNRLINRYSLVHDSYPVRIDLSVVRESKDGTKGIRDTNIFRINPKYEIEIEILNDKIVNLSKTDLDKLLKKVSKFVLSGLQSTNYPVAYTELSTIADEYMQLVNNKSLSKEPMPGDFIGPSSVTLQVVNIAPINTDSNIPNIRTNYTVTDKADGERKLLFITKTGKIYLINTQLNIEFTGAETHNSELFNTLLDGEHIKHNKLGSFINLYAAFDIYFINKKDVRALKFTTSTKGELPSNYRWNLLDNAIKQLSAVLVNTDKLPPIRIQIKQFYNTLPSQSIFAACNLINDQIKANQYEYNTDGFILTPQNLGVGLTPF